MRAVSGAQVAMHARGRDAWDSGICYISGRTLNWLRLTNRRRAYEASPRNISARQAKGAF